MLLSTTPCRFLPTHACGWHPVVVSLYFLLGGFIFRPICVRLDLGGGPIIHSRVNHLLAKKCTYYSFYSIFFQFAVDFSERAGPYSDDGVVNVCIAIQTQTQESVISPAARCFKRTPPSHSRRTVGVLVWIVQVGFSLHDVGQQYYPFYDYSYEYSTVL